MAIAPTKAASFQISTDKLFSIISATTSGNRGREDDEHFLKPGPWDPVIRLALERMNTLAAIHAPMLARHLHSSIFAPPPEPWKAILATILARHPEIWDAIGGGYNPFAAAELNPQPLPPHYAFLIAVAQTLTSRAELIQEIADSRPRKGKQQSIIIVSAHVSRFADDLCGTGFRLRWPFPGPRPHWFTQELTGIDLVVMAAQFDQAGKEAFSPDLQQSLANASAKFAETGLSRMN